MEEFHTPESEAPESVTASAAAATATAFAPLPALTPESGAFLLQTARWGKFLAIISFISIGFLYVSTPFALMLAIMPSSAGFTAGTTPHLFLTYAITFPIVATLYLFPSLYLLRYSRNARQSLESGDTALLTEALRNQKKLYKFIGITTIVCIALYILLIVAVIAAGVIFALSGGF